MREKILDVLRNSFKLYGYNPIETSILEYYEVAANKYAGGEEILKETYRLRDLGGRYLCLRYELTFKLAKLIGMNKGIALPIKRYEIGKVFRDGPVKSGRAREFTQCDVDAVGTASQIVDVEFTGMIKRVFSELSMPIKIKLNNKKLLFSLFESSGIPEEMFTGAALSVDKLEKIGKEKVISEMISRGISKTSCEKLFDIIGIPENIKDNLRRLEFIESRVGENDGTKELKEFLRFSKSFGTYKLMDFDPTLSRGLGYYTSSIWEVYAVKNPVKSSLAAGGRWDGMINRMFEEKRPCPAVGMTFGLDTIYDALKAVSFKKFIKRRDSSPLLLVVPIDTENDCIEFTVSARDYGIKCDIALGMSLKKAFGYADKKRIAFVGVIGGREAAERKITVKDISTGKSETLSWQDALYKFKRVKWR